MSLAVSHTSMCGAGAFRHLMHTLGERKEPRSHLRIVEGGTEGGNNLLALESHLHKAGGSDGNFSTVSHQLRSPNQAACISSLLCVKTTQRAPCNSPLKSSSGQERARCAGIRVPSRRGSTRSGGRSGSSGGCDRSRSRSRGSRRSSSSWRRCGGEEEMRSDQRRARSRALRPVEAP